MIDSIYSDNEKIGLRYLLPNSYDIFKQESYYPAEKQNDNLKLECWHKICKFHNCNIMGVTLDEQFNELILFKHQFHALNKILQSFKNVEVKANTLLHDYNYKHLHVDTEISFILLKFPVLQFTVH